MAEQDLLRLGQRGVGFGGRRGGDLGPDQAHRIIDEQPVLDPPARRRRGRCADPRRPHRRAVGDQRMAIDPRQHDRAIGDHRVEVGGGREILHRPGFLVPAAADNPARVRIGPRIILQSLLQLAERRGAGQVQLQRGEAQSHDMPVGVDQAGKQRPAAHVDGSCDGPWPGGSGGQHDLHFPVVADQQAVEGSDPSLVVGLVAVEIVDDRVGKGGGGRDQGGERDQMRLHGRAA